MNEKNKPRIFLPHVTRRRDPLTGVKVPTFDLSGASQHGDFRQLTDLDHRLDPAALPEALEQMKDRIGEMTGDDYIMILGDPILVAAAIAYASDTLEAPVKVLRFDRSTNRYESMEVTL